MKDILKINSVNKIYAVFGLSILSVILHNLFYAIFKVEEGVFFILTLVFFAIFVISIIYNTATYFRRGEPKDIWKLGWLGLFGIVGLFANAPGLYGLFGFLAYLGTKKS